MLSGGDPDQGRSTPTTILSARYGPPGTILSARYGPPGRHSLRYAAANSSAAAERAVKPSPFQGEGLGGGRAPSQHVPPDAPKPNRVSSLQPGDARVSAVNSSSLLRGPPWPSVVNPRCAVERVERLNAGGPTSSGAEEGPRREPPRGRSREPRPGPPHHRGAGNRAVFGQTKGRIRPDRALAN